MVATYDPLPIDTSSVTLSEDLNELLDLLAKNTHDVWAKQRIDDGWTYGAGRDDAAKTHPCLVPYEELPPSEQEYDLKTSAEVIKVILASGYTIQKR